MKAQTLKVRYRDPSGRSPEVVREVRVWDAALFLATESAAHLALKDPADRRLVSLVEDKGQ